jgi:hypothetical protein
MKNLIVIILAISFSGCAIHAQMVHPTKDKDDYLVDREICKEIIENSYIRTSGSFQESGRIYNTTHVDDLMVRNAIDRCLAIKFGWEKHPHGRPASGVKSILGNP